TGLSIEYDEDNNTFQFHQLPVCHNIASFNYYAYVCINDAILFFGGWNDRYGDNAVSKSMHKYSIQENKWIIFQNTLPKTLRYCAAILSEDNHIHIIGGEDENETSTNEIKYTIQYWIRVLKIKLGWINDFNKIVINY
ncbi:hypothetical protein RFI_35825, partial [Reticulomyxa filosa]